MRILFTIPHYYRQKGHKAADARHGSAWNGPNCRIAAISACITSLHQLFNDSQFSVDHASKVAFRFNRRVSCSIDVVLCTTGDDHLLAQVPLPSRLYVRSDTKATPSLLGYECHSVLRDRLGQYDYYCYLEDDLILHDPWFFIKMAWFTNFMGDRSLLQPNRFETSASGTMQRLYVDGELAAHCTAAFQDVKSGKLVTAEVLGRSVTFRRTLNPHSGSFFLNAAQMQHWAQQPYFLDRDTRFIGPLESAATLGIMRAFEVYKPAVEDVGFLEIEHHETAYIDMFTRGNQTSSPPEGAAPAPGA